MPSLKRISTAFFAGSLAVAWSTLSPTALAQATGKAVFVVNNVSDEITSFTLDDAGAAQFVGVYATDDGPMAIDISTDGKYLAITHGTANNVTEVITFFSVNDDASLTLLGTDLVPDSPLGVAWISGTVIAVTETCYGGDNAVRVYDFDPELATITEIDAEDTGAFNTALVRSPTGPYLFANDSAGSNTVYMFQINPDGTLDPHDSESTGTVYPLGPDISHDGTKLYAGGGISSGGDKVLGLSVDPEAGLQPLPGSPYTSPGESPAYCAVSTDDQFLFVGHGTDATVRSFAIAADGSLTYTGHFFDVGMQGTVGDLETIGDLLLITDESTAIDGIAGMYVFQVNPDGSFTQVGDIHDTQGVRPEAMISWTPLVVPGDLDGDGDVDQADLGILLAAYGIDDGGDCDGDGDTDQADLGILLANYGYGT
ncbi:MAG: beta-propeller fold lactonase family protein [Phycisphaerales bacterium]|nr:beta-propeller fold lactonase family protein [Phycisphaerales bacterium]